VDEKKFIWFKTQVEKKGQRKERPGERTDVEASRKRRAEAEVLRIDTARARSNR